MTDAKSYVPVVTLSTKDNRKLLQQFKSGFRGTINQNNAININEKYQQKNQNNIKVTKLILVSKE